MRNRKINNLIIMAGIAMLLYIIEDYLPINFPVVGVKLGLLNIVILILLYSYSYKEALLIVILKVLFAYFSCSFKSEIWLSLSGGLLSLYSMNLFKNTFKNNISVIGVSLIGSLSHNIGEILAAIIIFENLTIIYYLPEILFYSLITGLLIGIAAQFALKNIAKISKSV